MEHAPLLVDRRTATRILGLSLRTLDYLISSGELKPRRIGRRVLLEYRSLQAFARRDHPTKANAKGRSITNAN